MSQKPRPGDQARPASAAKTPANVPPSVVRAEPVVKAQPAAKPEAVAGPRTSDRVASGATTPVAKAEPVAQSRTVQSRPGMTTSVQPAAGVPSNPIAAVTTAATPTAAPVAAASITAGVVRTATVNEPTKTTLTQGITSMMKSTEDLVAFGQANLEAFVKSSQIWSAGVQELTKQMATSAKASFEESVSTFKAISTAKSVKEAMDLQSTFAKAALEKAMAESNKLTDASIKLTEQTLAPITARVTVAVETFGKTH
jgi:phasin family protein